MSSQPALPMSPALSSPSSSGQAVGGISIDGMSANGVLLFMMSFLVVASGYTAMRPDVMGLKLHPYLLPMAIGFPLVFLTRIHEFPIRILSALLVFTAMYLFSTFNGSSAALGEVFKLGSSVMVIITCALLVRKRGDFVAGALGLSIAVAFLAAQGLRDEGRLGVEAIQGANKNSYSLFALPAMLMAGYIVLHGQRSSMLVRGLLVACTLPALAAIFMSGNRSGYLGSVLVGLMLFKDRRLGGLILVAAISGGLAIWLTQFGNTQQLDYRLKQTVEGNKSDESRIHILQECLAIGLENPVLGVSPQQLPIEIGRRTQVRHGASAIESHNVFGHVFAGSGLICFAALLALGWTMWAWKPRAGGKVGGKEDPLRDTLRLLRMMVVLWVVRGMFTRDILYSPSFNIGLGLSIGLCMLAESARQATAGKNSKKTTAQTPMRSIALPRPTA